MKMATEYFCIDVLVITNIALQLSFINCSFNHIVTDFYREVGRNLFTGRWNAFFDNCSNIIADTFPLQVGPDPPLILVR